MRILFILSFFRSDSLSFRSDPRDAKNIFLLRLQYLNDHSPLICQSDFTLKISQSQHSLEINVFYTFLIIDHASYKAVAGPTYTISPL